MRGKRIGHYIGMAATAPGSELYRACGSLKKRPDIVRVILLVAVLALLTVLLWLLKGNLAELLIGGGLLAVAFFYLYFLMLKSTERVIGFMERCLKPFDEAFRKHARALYGKRVDGTEREDSAERAKKNSAKKNSRENASAQNGKQQAKKGDAKSRTGTTDARGRTAGQQGEQTKQRESQQGRKQTRQQTTQRESQQREERSKQQGARGGAVRNGSAELEEAQMIYAVRMPYTTDEIKQKRNILLKKYHPDNAEGSEEMCKKINECYRILCRYAS